MVTAVTTKTTTTTRKTATLNQNQNQSSTRRPLLSSEPENALVPPPPPPLRRPKSREVSSRYMSSSSASITPKRSSSPLISRPPATTVAPPSIKRSVSADRRRPVTPRSNSGSELQSAEKILIKSTRSLSVSFQGESFSLQVTKVKPTPSPVNGERKVTPERRRATPIPARVADQVEISRPTTIEKHLWPGRLRLSNSSMSRSLDFTDNSRSITKIRSSNEIKLTSNSIEIKRTDVKCGPLVAFDTESVSSRVTESYNNNRLQSQPELGSPVAKAVGLNVPLRPKLLPPKKLGIDSPLSSPRGRRQQLSPIRDKTLTHPASPSKQRELPRTSSPMRGASPSRVRNAIGGGLNSNSGYSPSVLSFGNDVWRMKIGESRIRNMHLLRVLHNRLLQWRFVNAKAHTALLEQKSNAEESLYTASMTTARVRESVRTKRIQLQWLRQALKLASILQEQMMYLEEFSFLCQDYSCSLSGATESLRASTLRLPVIAGARADVIKVKEAICSAVGVMLAMASSVCLLSPEVDQVNSMVAEVANIMVKEFAMLNQCKNLLSACAAMQATESSLRTQVIQLQ